MNETTTTGNEITEKQMETYANLLVALGTKPDDAWGDIGRTLAYLVQSGKDTRDGMDEMIHLAALNLAIHKSGQTV